MAKKHKANWPTKDDKNINLENLSNLDPSKVEIEHSIDVNTSPLALKDDLRLKQLQLSNDLKIKDKQVEGILELDLLDSYFEPKKTSGYYQ